MDTKQATDKDIKDRRQGKLSMTGDILSGKTGRKVFIGVWVFIMANVWFGLSLHKGGGFSEKTYLILSVAAVLLIGFGTITDTLVSELGHKVVDVVGGIIGARIGVISSKVEKKTESTTEVTSATAPTPES